MAHNFQTWLDAPVIELQSIDSTNNYAMQLIDADKAQLGMTIIAKEQTSGKGQRGNQWISIPGENLLMSMIVVPEMPIEKQFLFSAAIAVAVSNCVTNLGIDCYIKWPNDLIINDRKTGGILIENIIRGSLWTYAVVGIGINILQNSFPESLPFATSLKRETKIDFDIKQIANAIRQSIIKTIYLPNGECFDLYRKRLYKHQQKQQFSLKGNQFNATIIDVLTTGQIVVEREVGNHINYRHGEIEWIW